ncbi:SARP family transcriptional regulator [Nonomuraea sp. PA05]|uniref:AfsR/SARP family transcriptional regulator n=1 Tax=Nonomuraea sp. PA05 TaxID=2604466 RepID=UPI0011D8FF97|nr:BTAD domain-containing putative transcriptional regulator [Nonomuraea sp. PA05]TYB64789.1 SARP family transcriptional regulator [Nonomuraea sp. PA05]
MTNRDGSPSAAVAVVHLVGGPYVHSGGRRLEVPEGSKRLLVFVAVSGGKVDRRHAAGTLWPHGDDVRAAGNLRSALWRLRTARVDVIDSDKPVLTLRRGTVVDTDLLCAWADRVVDPRVPTSELRGLQWRTEALNLLPGWHDDWVIFERERLRQRILHALEALSRRCAAAGRHDEAVDAALAAVCAEPLRESAQKALVSAHLAEGNLSEARRVYRNYRRLLARELGVRPSAGLTALVGLHNSPVRPSAAR